MDQAVPATAIMADQLHASAPKSLIGTRGLQRLLFWQACLLLSQATVGYDEVLLGSLQAMPAWVRDMGNPAANIIGLLVTIIFIGGFIGALIAPTVSDRFGRRVTIFTGSALCLAGSIIQTAARGRWIFLVGRLIIGFGTSFTSCAGPPLVNELSHPAFRGTIASLFNVLWYVGSIVAAWTAFGTSHMQSSSWSWRIPSLLQVVPSTLVASLVLFMPESPRYLCSRGQVGKARDILAFYHANGDSNHPIVEAQLQEITAALEAEADMCRASFVATLRSKANRKRYSIVVAVSLLTLWCGQGVISYYFSPILDSVGIRTVNEQTGINGGMQIWNFLCALTGAILSDRIGRRPLWLLSFSGMLVANVVLTITSAVYSKTESYGAAISTIVFLFLYNAAFNLACNPLLYTYTPEILPYSIRAKGLGLQVALSQAALTVNQYVNPIALSHIGYYYYIFYMGVLVFGLIIIYFFFPETKGKTLEELAGLFSDEPQVTVEVYQANVEKA